uniref:Uncharacterized protein n=1 Tax=viral metagenome TaxID=1070528 RepID=A0A6H2A541_9ZZZZ
MNPIEVKAKLGKEAGGAAATIYVNAPETLEEAEKAYGAEEVLSNAIANWKVTIQAGIRRMLAGGSVQDTIQAAYKDCKMGTALARVSDPRAAIIAKWGSMSKEERASMLADLKLAEK